MFYGHDYLKNAACSGGYAGRKAGGAGRGRDWPMAAIPTGGGKGAGRCRVAARFSASCCRGAGPGALGRWVKGAYPSAMGLSYRREPDTPQNGYQAARRLSVTTRHGFPITVPCCGRISPLERSAAARAGPSPDESRAASLGIRVWTHYCMSRDGRFARGTVRKSRAIRGLHPGQGLGRARVWSSSPLGNAPAPDLAPPFPAAACGGARTITMVLPIIGYIIA